MKYNYFYMALFAIATLAITGLTTACGSDNDDDTPKVPEKIVKYAEQALSLELLNDVYYNDKILRRTELTEGGECLLTLVDNLPTAKTRLVIHDILSYVHGTYTVKDNTYTIYIDGKKMCDITVSNKNGTTTNAKIEFENGSAFEVTARLAQRLTDSATKELCATWKVKKTRLRLEGDVTGAADFNGCNLHEILEYAKKRGGNISQEFDVNKIVTDIKFTSWGTFEINYKDGKPDVGTWTWQNRTNGAITYHWNDPYNMGNDFENGTATFDQRAGSYCLTLGADVKYENKNYNASISLYLE